MSAIRVERFFQGVTEGFKSLVRGYTPAELAAATRILVEGIITPADRLGFIDRRFNALAIAGGALLLNNPLSLDSTTFVSPQGLAEVRQEEQRLRDLLTSNPPAFDLELQADWRNRAQIWGVKLASSPLHQSR